MSLADHLLLLLAAAAGLGFVGVKAEQRQVAEKAVLELGSYAFLVASGCCQ